LGGIFDPNSAIIDTDRDLTSFPPEEYPLSIFPVEIEEEGDHTIYCVILPLINDQVIPLGFGGGLRSVELCGGLRPFGQSPETPPDLEGVTELKPEFQFTVDFGLEYRLLNQNDEIVQDWTSVAGWTENAALCFGGGMSIDYEAMKAAMCEAMECGAEKIAARYLSGTVENLAGGDIVLTPGQSPVVVPPGQAPNDPSTTADEEKYSGAAQGVYLGFRQLILDINSYIITQGLNEINTHTRIAAKYKTNSTMQAAITAYGAHLVTPIANWTTPVITAALASYIYCRGNSHSTIASYIINTWDAEVNDLLGLLGGLEDEQLDIWYNAGKLVPSTDYLAYTCVPIASYDFTLTALPQTLNDTHVFKKNHRYEVISEGYWLDSEGDLQDSFWTKANNATEIFSTSLFNLQIGGAIKRLPTIFESPYNAQHRYKWTIDMGTNDAAPQWNLLKWGSLNASINSPSGGIKISVKDLGEYTT
jgi:hypothetical protein